LLVDVSEVKSFRACKRAWKFSSRNGYHLRPRITPPYFALGTAFHYGLQLMYLGTELDKILATLQLQYEEHYPLLKAMLTGYHREVYPEDANRFQVLTTEHRFSFKPEEFEHVDITITGSIDMIALDLHTNEIFGFEHKTAKTFRKDSQLWMDEQPRLYHEAMRIYRDAEQLKNPAFNPTIGGVYINEVKKLVRDFSYQRTLCTYTDLDMQGFLNQFYKTALEVYRYRALGTEAEPCPSYMGCQLCSFNQVCAKFRYEPVDLDRILGEFEEELAVRTGDHLDEKEES